MFGVKEPTDSSYLKYYQPEKSVEYKNGWLGCTLKYISLMTNSIKDVFEPSTELKQHYKQTIVNANSLRKHGMFASSSSDDENPKAKEGVCASVHTDQPKMFELHNGLCDESTFNKHFSKPKASERVYWHGHLPGQPTTFELRHGPHSKSELEDEIGPLRPLFPEDISENLNRLSISLNAMSCKESKNKKRKKKHNEHYIDVKKLITLKTPIIPTIHTEFKSQEYICGWNECADCFGHALTKEKHSQC